MFVLAHCRVRRRCLCVLPRICRGKELYAYRPTDQDRHPVQRAIVRGFFGLPIQTETPWDVLLFSDTEGLVAR